MKLWNTSRYLFSQCKIYNLSISFFFNQGTSDLEPSQVHCMLKAACATQLQSVHLHRLWCEWQPPLPLKPLYKQVVQCSSPELPHTPLYTFCTCCRLHCLFFRPDAWLLSWIFSYCYCEFSLHLFLCFISCFLGFSFP